MSLDADAPPIETASPRVRKSRKRAFTEWIIIVVAAVLASLFLRTFVFQTFSIPSRSMKPTLYVGNRVVVDKLSVTFGTINIGDIMVFKAPADVTKDCGDAVTDLVKRVIGLPGDQLTSKGNTIYVNGKPLKEAWSHYEPLGNPIGHVTVSANHYFMMGDNHANSCDSRYWGTVPRSDMIGKVFLKFWPLGQWHWF
ncbi:MAG TPA: signal peptidase I [Acidimicrobiales bacterium]|nr:signal peptidase I [Acidimicrobiales bacterium]